MAATLTYRGQHRLAGGNARAGADWALALVLSIGTEPFLARQVIALTVGEARRRCASGEEDQLVASTMTELLEAAQDATEPFRLAEEQAGMFAIILEACRVLGAICFAKSADFRDERQQFVDAAHAAARQVDAVTGDAFQLVELAQHRLGAGSSDSG